MANRFTQDSQPDSLDSDFEEVFERYYFRVSRFFYRRGFSTEESEDLAQKTFLRAYKGWQRYRLQREAPHGHGETWDTYRKKRSPEDQDSSWVFTIALNTYRNEIRRRRTKKRDAPVRSLGPLRDQGWEPPSTESPEEDLLTRQRVDLLRRSLDELPPAMRRCFELRFGHGLKYREIAEVLKISIQSVRSQLHQARKRLEDLLSDR